MGHKYSLDFKQEVIDFYKSRPMSYQVVCDKFNISSPTVGKWLKEFNVKPYTKVQQFSPNLKEDFFETIDTEEKAYYLGLIITDGCIYDPKNGRQRMVAISLQEGDKYILDKFVETIGSSKKVTSDGRGCYGIQILSDKMVSDLEKYGIMERKSLSTIFPKIEEKYYPHLIRGILDGDGSVAFYSRPDRKVHHKALIFCQGCEQFLINLENKLKEHGINASCRRLDHENCWMTYYEKNSEMLKLINYLYNDATVYMIRKKELCDKVKAEIKLYNGNTEITE